MKQNQSFMGWLLLFLHLLFFHSSSSNFLCHHDESSALLQFISSFTDTATWKNGSDCCSWDGITCDTISGHVIGLDLGGVGLYGKLHPNSTLFRLAHLQKLNLSYNYFIDTPFHFKFGRFLSLTHLDLSWCYFEGEVPIQISHLSKLESLHLSMNGLVWKETTMKRLVQNATNLRELILDDTDMSLIRPNFMVSIFNQSSSLVTLNLQHTYLSGKLKKSVLCLPMIQELDMSDNNNLEGQLPVLSCSTSLRILDLSNCLFKGPIPLSFSNLTHLTSLIISDNNLNGSIPSSLFTLPRLTSLDLGNNDLSGQIPNVYPQSNRFEELDLSNNKIEGEIPSSLSNLQQLAHLGLSSNLFSGQIPDVLGRMTKLQYLYLASNNLEGQIPSSLFNSTQLVELDFSYNKLKGLLPKNITGFQKLSKLSLMYNLLNGTIPLWCLCLPSLVKVDLSNNRLTGHIDDAFSSNSLAELYLNNNMLQGEIPESIFSLANLQKLWLHSNNLSGVVNFQIFSKLQYLSDLSLSWNSQLSLYFESSNVSNSFNQLETLKLSYVNLIEFHKLQGQFERLLILDLSNNKLNGMPNCLIEAYQLSFLNLSRNLFTSTDQLIEMAANHKYLNNLDLSFNLLNGDIPLALCNMSSDNFEFLNLGHNNLTGIIPQCLSNLPYLKFLDLQMNKFHGILPTNFPDNLVVLNLNGNLLEGLLPKSLSHCKYLDTLDLGSNRLKDKFPNWLQTLQDLKVLVLRDNMFHGPIANLKIKHLFPSLLIFDISGNNFSGFLPKAYLKNYEAMKIVTQVGGDSSSPYIDPSCYMPYQGTKCTNPVTVTTKGIKVTFVRVPKFFVSIDLSRNKFEGEIPNAIGELHALKGLNLSHNRLIGHIPQSMGNLTNMESLDLSSNMLTGVIPAELTNLGFLAVLNLSNNHLVGDIPQGKQFNTFSNDSYEGNLGLCGFPLSKICGPEPHPPPSPSNFESDEKFGFGWKPVAIGYGCGFVIGIGLGYLVFLIGKPRWLVMIFGGQPKKRRRARARRTNGLTVNQMVQMS